MNNYSRIIFVSPCRHQARRIIDLDLDSRYLWDKSSIIADDVEKLNGKLGGSLVVVLKYDIREVSSREMHYYDKMMSEIYRHRSAMGITIMQQKEFNDWMVNN